MNRRLFAQIFRSVLLVSVAVVLLVGLVARFVWFAGERAPRFLENAAEQIAAELRREGIDAPDLPGRLRAHAERAGVWASIWNAESELVAFSGPPEVLRHFERAERHLGREDRWPWRFFRRYERERGRREWSERWRGEDDARYLRSFRRRLARIAGVGVEIEEGYWLRVVPDPGGAAGWRPGLLSGFVLLGTAIAGGAWIVARRIAGRLERLQRGVERLGRGDLEARVRVEGEDEVAALARSFNLSADRIAALVEAQRRILASASHELRTPLARLRMAVELLAEESARGDLREEAERDIDELDGLIEDLLLSTRVQSGVATTTEKVDLHALVAEEAERLGPGAGVRMRASEETVALEGNRRELRRLVRNLLENAVRHGASEHGASEHGASVEGRAETPSIDVELDANAHGGVRLRVLDRGPGVAPEDRERIFEPFYRPADHSEGSDGGVGLGLALVREIARQHGGDARCLGREGGGSIFEVRLGAQRLAAHRPGAHRPGAHQSGAREVGTPAE